MRAVTFFQLAALTALSAVSAPALAKDPHKPAVITAPVTLQAATSDVPGTVKLTWQAVKGVTEYIIASSRETTTSWQSVALTSAPAYEFVDLPEGTKYYFRVACNTKAGPGPWSEPVVLTTTTTTTKVPMAALPRPITLSDNTQTRGR